MAVPRPKDVLVVEDEPMIRIMTADLLADAGIMAWEASTAEEALLILTEHPSIGLVFTDVNLPGAMDGLSLAREVNNRRPEVELLVTSGGTRLSSEDLPDHGTFLPKPFQPRTLLGVIAEKLDVER